MLLSRASLAFLLAASVAAASAFATPTHKKSSSPHARSARTSAHSSKATSKTRKESNSRRTKLRGQQGIDSSRASEIQQALIREHYLTGEPTGQWDSATISAMQKFQGDQG